MSVSDVSLPTFLLSVITGAAYQGLVSRGRRSLFLTHDILGCAGHTKNAKWDAMAFWLRTTVRQGSVIKVLNGLGSCGTEVRARQLEKHGSNITLREVDEGVTRVVRKRNGVVSFALGNFDISTGPSMAGRLTG